MGYKAFIETADTPSFETFNHYHAYDGFGRGVYCRIAPGLSKLSADITIQRDQPGQTVVVRILNVSARPIVIKRKTPLVNILSAQNDHYPMTPAFFGQGDGPFEDVSPYVIRENYNALFGPAQAVQ